MQKTTIQLPTPCHESWAAMTPTASGRYCAACAKTVVDFTAKTDAEILTYLAQAASGPTCGRFRASQLDRPLAPPAAPTRWRAWLGAILTTGGLLGSARAIAQNTSYQTSGSPAPLAIHPAAIALAAPAAPATPEVAVRTGPHEPLTLRGVVLDTKNGTLPGATVLVKGTTQGTSTTMNGEFTLQITGDKSNLILVISSVGFVTREQPIAIGATGVAVPVQVKLEEDVVGALLLPRPYPWHPSEFFNWGKYWLTRPFRR